MTKVRLRDSSRRWNPWAILAALVTVTLAVSVPRVAGLSGYPLTDEGYYAYYAMRIQSSLLAGHGLPDDGYLMLYPMLASWTFSLPGNTFVLLRLVDLIVASVAGLLLFRVLMRESGSLAAASLLSFVFLFSMSAAPFIQNGFKNSFFAAYIPLFTALALSQSDRITRSRWAAIGALIATGVLLRESFAPFAGLAVVAVWVRHGTRSLFDLCAGAAVTTGLVLLAVLGARGGVTGLFQSYDDAAISFAALQDQRAALFVSGASTAMKLALVPLLLTAAAIIAGFSIPDSNVRRAAWGRGAFWLAASLLPLIEPASKIGFAYHFSACLPGMAGLCAWGWRTMPTVGWKRAGLGVLVAASALSTASVWQLANRLPEGLMDAQQVAKAGWPAEAHTSTNYLIAADLIASAAPHGGTLSVSGFMFPLFPLTELSPPSPDLSDLSLALIKMEMNADRLSAAIASCSPDVILTSNRTEFPGAQAIEDAVRTTGLYRKVGEVSVDPSRAYGTFGGGVYQRVKSGGHACGQK